jgi:hypothetical protein
MSTISYRNIGDLPDGTIQLTDNVLCSQGGVTKIETVQQINDLIYAQQHPYALSGLGAQLVNLTWTNATSADTGYFYIKRPIWAFLFGDANGNFNWYFNMAQASSERTILTWTTATNVRQYALSLNPGNYRLRASFASQTTGYFRLYATGAFGVSTITVANTIG